MAERRVAPAGGGAGLRLKRGERLRIAPAKPLAFEILKENIE